MDKSLGTLLRFWGVFQFIQIHNPSPPLTPQTMLDACIQSFFFEFQLCIVWGKGELQENFEKDALF